MKAQEIMAIIETLENGVERSWDEDLSAYTFTLPDSNRATVTTYIEAVLESINEWDTSKPYYGIQDIRNPKVSLTPYMRGRLNEITQLYKDRKITCYVALVMNNNFTAGVMKALGQIMSRNNRYITISSFSDTSKAQEWIRQHQS